MIATRREYHRRVVEDDNVEATIQGLLDEGWEILEPPEEVDSHVEHLRERVDESDLTIRIAELGKDGWEEFNYEAPEDAAMDARFTLSAWRTAKVFYRICAARQRQVTV